jgi:endonuclease YncB( thermonuclease family)
VLNAPAQDGRRSAPEEGLPSTRPAMPGPEIEGQTDRARRASEGLPAHEFEGQPALEVLDVRAGNVVVVRMAGENRELRLIGVYVPHCGSADDAARPFLARLLGHEQVWVRYEADWPLCDREGRHWAYVYRAPDGLFANLELIRLGYARLSAPDPFPYQKLFRAYERRAEAAHKGLWNDDPPAATQAAVQPVAATQPAPAKPGPAKTAPSPPPAAATDATVFVTPNGEKYHRADCRHVSANSAAVTVAEAKRRGYRPCAMCRPPD